MADAGLHPVTDPGDLTEFQLQAIYSHPRDKDGLLRKPPDPKDAERRKQLMAPAASLEEDMERLEREMLSWPPVWNKEEYRAKIRAKWEAKNGIRS